MAETGAAGMGSRERHFLILAVVTLVAVVAAAVSVSIQRGSEAGSFKPRLAFEGFEERVDEIRTLRIRSKDGELTIRRDDDFVWRMEETHGFPVLVDRVRQTILSLADLDLVEAKTARADWHHHLGLVRPEEGGEGIVVSVFDGAGAEMASLVVGQVQGLPDINGETRRYVRLAQETQTWVALGRLEPVTEEQGWLDFNFLNIERERVRKVTSIPGNASKGNRGFTAERPMINEYNFMLQDIPAGYEATSPGSANGVGSALMALSLQGVRPASDIDFSKPAKLIYETFDGLIITLDVTAEDGDYWVAVTADAPEEPTEAALEEAETSEGETLAADARPSLKTEADAINRRARDWAFKVPEWKGNQLTVALDSLIQPIGASEEAEEN